MAYKTQQPGVPIPPGTIGMQWMEKPPASNSPPGLEYLGLIDNIQIKQKKELAEIVLGWETSNRYVILNGSGQQVYHAYEESGCLTRQCCGSNRGFILHIVDNFNQEVMRISRPFMCCAGCSWCAIPGTCCSFSLTVEAPVGNVIGTVQQRVAGCSSAYQILDSDGTKILDIDGPCACCMLGCQDKVFNIHTNNGAEIGAIRKKWSGFLQEAFTDADNFGVNFPMDLAIRTKATLIGATFLIDFMNFESNPNDNNRQ